MGFRNTVRGLAGALAGAALVASLGACSGNTEVVEQAEVAAAQEVEASVVKDAVPVWSPAVVLGEGSESLRLVNKLGDSVAEAWLKASGSEEWPQELAFTGQDIEDGVLFEIKHDLADAESVDVWFKTKGGATYEIKQLPLSITPDEGAALTAEGELATISYLSLAGELVKFEGEVPAVEEVVEEEPASEEVAEEQGEEAETYSEPAYSEPTYNEPTYSEPTYSEPTYTEPIYSEPEPEPVVVPEPAPAPAPTPDPAPVDSGVEQQEDGCLGDILG